MGAPKGKTHCKFTSEEKLAYITEFQESYISRSRFAKEHDLNVSMLRFPVHCQHNLASIKLLKVYYPTTSRGQQELAERVPRVHTDLIYRQVIESVLQCIFPFSELYLFRRRLRVYGK